MQHHNNKLLNALSNFLICDNYSTTRQLSSTLRDGVLLLPTAESFMAIEQKVLANQYGKVHADLIITTDSSGSTIMCAFTDGDALVKWLSGPCTYVVVKASNIFAFAVKNSISKITINISGPVGLILNQQEIACLAHGGESDFFVPNSYSPLFAGAFSSSYGFN